MLEQEKKKMQAERKEEAAAEKHKKVDLENRKHEVFTIYISKRQYFKTITNLIFTIGQAKSYRRT